MPRRIWKHKTEAFEGFSKRFHTEHLVYFERYPTIGEAVAREKQIKRWRRAKKVQLIELENPSWADLAAGWFDDPFWCVPPEWETGSYGYLQ